MSPLTRLPAQRTIGAFHISQLLEDPGDTAVARQAPGRHSHRAPGPRVLRTHPAPESIRQSGASAPGCGAVGYLRRVSYEGCRYRWLWDDSCPSISPVYTSRSAHLENAHLFRNRRDGTGIRLRSFSTTYCFKEVFFAVAPCTSPSEAMASVVMSSTAVGLLGDLSYCPKALYHFRSPQPPSLSFPFTHNMHTTFTGPRIGRERAGRLRSGGRALAKACRTIRRCQSRHPGGSATEGALPQPVL